MTRWQMRLSGYFVCIFCASVSYSEIKDFSGVRMSKRFWCCILIMLLCFQPIVVLGAQETSLEMEAPSVILMEMSTGEMLYGKNEQDQRSPASVTKIMTLLLIFEEIEKGNLKLEDVVTTSAHAKSMGGSQVFLEEGEQQTVETMIKCIVIASGNDASVAMAEHIGGSETQFVSMMNKRAQELGMKNTHFEDCCGLSDSDNHYTSAEDVAIMSRELVLHYPEILDYSSIWMENITHVTQKGSSEFGLTNTNKMLRSYSGCVGLKTGSTSKAKFCVSTVAKRDGMTLLAVVMGGSTSKTRFKDAATLLNYGFSKCHLYTDENLEDLDAAPVVGGVKDTVPCKFESSFSFVDTQGRNLEKIEKKIVYDEKLKAPLKKGSVVGWAVYFLDGAEIGSVDLISTQKIEKATYMDYIKMTFGRWVLGKEPKE